MTQPFPILEFDSSTDAALNPSTVLKPHAKMSPRVVLCFFQDAIKNAVKDAEPIIDLGSEIGKNPVYTIEHEGQSVTIAHPGIGAPMAAGFMEELIALGGRTFVACGGAGVLDKRIHAGHVVIPTSAVRDEGTSYHYLPPAREVRTNPHVVSTLEQVLQRHQQPYELGKTWTTDAIYRETRAKVAARREEGCITVEMETSAFLAVAEFRQVVFGQYLYGGDDVSGEIWDERDWRKQTIRERLFWYAVEAVFALEKETSRS
jgi:uridine phosphorylase